jgi:uncharacterized membrane protein
MTSKIRRSLVKTLTWRIVATTDTFIIAWLITGEWTWASAIAGVEVLTKMFLYYGHERVWNKIAWAKEYKEPHTTIFPYKEDKRW